MNLGLWFALLFGGSVLTLIMLGLLIRWDNKKNGVKWDER